MIADTIRNFEWRQPGCGERCWYRGHDPVAHEAYGFRLGRLASQSVVVRTGPLTLDLAAHTVQVADQAVRISGREWDLLAYLAERVGRWCQAEQLVCNVLGPEWISPARVGTSHERRNLHYLRVIACRLRRKLGAAGALIVSGRAGDAGYRLEARP